MAKSPALSPVTLRRWRLQHQMLTGAPASDAASVVQRLGAVQSQDYPGASWALALRLGDGVTRRDIDDAFDRGKIVRTHLMRPTWHFVSPHDIRWILQLTGSRVIAGGRSRRDSIGLDAKTVVRGLKALERALEGGRACTREQVRRVLARARVACPDTERFAHVMLVAENEGLVCSGARAGSEQTYVLLDERVPPAARTPTRDEAVRELVRRYYGTHGPATTQDFVVWSGLTQGDARTALRELSEEFAVASMDGREWWYPRECPDTARGVVARLIPNFDEYYIGFKHREPLFERLQDAAIPLSLYQILQHLILIDGQVVGHWKRVPNARGTTLTLAPRVPLTARERAAVEREVPRLAAFHDDALSVRWS